MAVEERMYPDRQKPPSNALVWRIGPRRILATVLGTGLSVLTTLTLQLFTLPNAAGGLITVSPGIVIPLFFGVTSGPIVGLLVGTLGTGIGELISYHTFYWNWDLGYGLIGCAAGLSLLFTARHDKNIFVLVLLQSAGIVAIIPGIGFAAFTDIWVAQVDGSAAAGEFLFAAITNVCNGIILLPIVLVIYHIVREKKERFRRMFSRTRQKRLSLQN